MTILTPTDAQKATIPLDPAHLVDVRRPDGTPAGRVVAGILASSAALGPSLFKSATGQLQATGLFNVRSFGAVGDGQTHPLSSIASFQGSATAGSTLAQWQTIFPHATALSNEIDWCAGQAALDAAAAAGGGVAYWPASAGYGYLHDQELVVPTTPSVSLLGDGPRSVLFWPTDLGAGKFAIRTTDNAPPAQEIFVHHLTVQGGFNFAIGQQFRLQAGVLASNNVNLRFCYISGFLAGVQFINDHAQVMYCKVQGNYYNLYWGDGGTTYGNHYVAFCGLGGAAMASIGVHWNGGLDTCAFYSNHLGFSPYGIYKEAAPAGQTARSFLTNSTLVDQSFEECGTGGIYDTNTDPNVAFENNVCINCNIAMTGSEYVLPGVARPAVIYVGSFGGNLVLGSQPLIISIKAYPYVSVALIQTRGGCFDNALGSISTWLEDAPNFPAIGMILAGNDSPDSTWDTGQASGYFSQVVQTANPYPAGTLVRAIRGRLAVNVYGFGQDNDNIAGVLAAVGQPNYLAPVCTAGTVSILKTAPAISGDKRVHASLGTPGAIEEYNPAVSAPSVGAVVQDASGTDATALILLRIQQPMLSGYNPTATGSRSTATADVLEQVLTALAANGILLDGTTA